MPRDLPLAAAAVSKIDVSPAIVLDAKSATLSNEQPHMVPLLKRIIELQELQLEIAQKSAQAAEEAQHRRQAEIEQWQKKNQHLVTSCRDALEVLEGVQRAFLGQMAEYVVENEESLLDGEFLLSEFVDRFGPRMAHLSGVMNMLGQLVAAGPSSEE